MFGSSSVKVHSMPEGYGREPLTEATPPRVLTFSDSAPPPGERVVELPPKRLSNVPEDAEPNEPSGSILSTDQTQSDAVAGRRPQTILVSSSDAQAHEDLAAHLDALPSLMDPAYADGLHEATRKAPWFLSRLAQVMYSTPGSFCRGMGPKRLYPHQLVSHLHFRHVAKTICDAEAVGSLEAYQSSVPRGYLMYHATGTGKTAVQAAIVDACDDLFRLHGWSIYFVTTPENRDDNGIHKLHEWAQVCPIGARESSGLATQQRIAERGIRECRTGSSSYMSYSTFINSLAKGDHVSLDRAIVVLDEAHSIVAPQKESDASLRGDFIRTTKALQAAQGRVLYVLLTATPGDYVVNAMRLLRLLEWPHAAAPATVGEALSSALHHARAKVSIQSAGNRDHLSTAAIDEAWKMDADPELVSLYDADSEVTQQRIDVLASRLHNRTSYVDLREVRGLFPHLERVDVIVSELGQPYDGKGKR